MDWWIPHCQSSHSCQGQWDPGTKHKKQFEWICVFPLRKWVPHLTGNFIYSYVGLPEGKREQVQLLQLGNRQHPDMPTSRSKRWKPYTPKRSCKIRFPGAFLGSLGTNMNSGIHILVLGSLSFTCHLSTVKVELLAEWGIASILIAKRNIWITFRIPL